MKYTIHILLVIVLLLSGCFKKEDAIILPAGNSEIRTIWLGKDYEKEMYFEISSNSFQEKQSADWDIRFESGSDEHGVFLNNGNLIIAKKIEVYDLKETRSKDTFYFKEFKELVDAPNGKADKAAMADWKSYTSLGPDPSPGIYVIELSYLSGIDKYKRVQILSVNDSAYRVIFSNLEDKDGKPVTVGDTVVIPKDKSRNYTYYSFKNGGHIVANAEPDKNTWDLVFTRYKHIFYGILPGNEPFPYRVTGVLSSPNNVIIARDSMDNFNQINASSIAQFTFSDDLNVIGYDWKSHAFGAAGNYTVNSKITYIIMDTKGDYYKLRFLDFYDTKGEKGYPKFEFVQIK